MLHRIKWRNGAATAFCESMCALAMKAGISQGRAYGERRLVPYVQSKRYNPET